MARIPPNLVSGIIEPLHFDTCPEKTDWNKAVDYFEKAIREGDFLSLDHYLFIEQAADCELINLETVKSLSARAYMIWASENYKKNGTLPEAMELLTMMAKAYSPLNIAILLHLHEQGEISLIGDLSFIKDMKKLETWDSGVMNHSESVAYAYLIGFFVKKDVALAKKMIATFPNEAREKISGFVRGIESATEDYQCRNVDISLLIDWTLVKESLKQNEKTLLK